MPTIENKAVCPQKGSLPEHAVRHGTLAEAARKAGYTGRCIVRVKSLRKRLIDPDNLCAKWFLDALRYAGVIHDDRPQDIIYQITQEKSKEEGTEIEIEYRSP